MYGGSGTDEPGRQAALWTWITAAVELVLAVPCSLLLGVLAMLPTEQLRQSLEQAQVEPEMASLVVQQQTMLLVRALLVFGVLVVPALVLIWLGFGLQARRAGPATATTVILGVQIAFVGLILLGALFSGDVAALVANVLVFGALLALLIWTLTRVRTAAAAGAAEQEPVEPWNESG